MMMQNTKYIFFDVETNGSTVKEHRIIQFSCLVLYQGDIIKYDTFVQQDDIAPYITNSITGIELDDSWNGISERQLVEHLQSIITPGSVMIAHNAQFDMSFLHDLFSRHLSTEQAYTILSNCEWIDTLTVIRDRKLYNKYQSTHQLKDCIEHYGIPNVKFHDASEDCMALLKLYCAMQLELDNIELYTNIFGYNPEYPVYEKFDFITYKPQYLRFKGPNMADENQILPKL